MNQGRISRHYRNRRGMDVARNLCLRCFKFGHRRGPQCKNDPLVTCGKCYRVYMFTKDCAHEKSTQEEMTLRLVSGNQFPRPIIDVTIGIKSYEALINMTIEKTRISLDVLEHINECQALINEPQFNFHTDIVEFTIRRRNSHTLLQLDVLEHQTDSVILGMDFFIRNGFNLTVDRVSINERSPVMKCPKSIDFLYNQPQGQELHSWLQENNRPTYNEYKKGEHPELIEEPRVVIENNLEIIPANNDDILQIHLSDDDLDID